MPGSALTPIRKLTKRNTVELIRGGRDYFSLLEKLIDQAKYSIHLHVYIFDSDATGTRIADALINAAARKVQVFLMVDGYGSGKMSRELKNRIYKAGIYFKIFEPLLRTRSFYFGRRLHHKLTVIDAKICLVTGINISDRYNDSEKNTAWLDWALCCEGEIAVEVMKVCSSLWTRSRKFRKKMLLAQELPPLPDNHCEIRIRQNDWVQRKTQITTSYYKMLRNAESEVIIMSSYFLPGIIFRNMIRRATRRNVRIRLILAGLSDIRLAKNAERFIYRWLLRQGVEIYEYQKSVLHGKLATYDQKWVTAGSYNMNDISAFASMELNLDIADPDFAAAVHTRLNVIIENECRRVTEEHHKSSFNILNRFIQWLSYRTIRVLFYLFTFYFRQR